MYNGNGSVNITQKGNSRCVKLLGSDIPSRSIYEMLANFLELNSKSLVFLSSEKEKINLFLELFTSFIKREIRTFHVVVVQ